MTDKKRPGSMSDDDRALVGAKHRANTPVEGTVFVEPQSVPIGEFTQGSRDFTPVTEVLDRMRQKVVLTERDEVLVNEFWKHTANMTLRWSNTDAALLDKRLDDVEKKLVDLTGTTGVNGKVGNLQNDVKSINTRAWTLLTMALGGLGFLVVKVVLVTRAFDAVEHSAANNAARLQLIERVLFLKSSPVMTPDKPATATEKPQ